MTTSIKDGTGQGYQAEVDSDNRLLTRAIIEPAEHYANHDLGQSFSLYFNVTPTGAGDCFFYCKNTNTHDVIFEDLQVYVASNEAIDVYLNNTGTPSGGTTLTEANLNTSSKKTLTATIQYGNDITGLTQATQAVRYYVPADSATHVFNFRGDIILAPQTTLTLYAVTGGINMVGNFNCYIRSEVT